MQNKYKKNLFKVLFIVILLSFIMSLYGCGWFPDGLFGILDPWAKIIVDYTLVDLTEGAGTISLEIYSLNGVGFNASGFSYEYYYYSGITKIPIFTKVVEANFYVKPSASPGAPGPVTTIENLPFYFQGLLDWLILHPLVTEVNCDLNLIGKDTSNHSQTIQVASNLPVLQPGIDFYPPTAVISVLPDTTGTAPFTVVFGASGSTDVGSGIASYSWDFGDDTSATGIMPAAHTYTSCGTYIVKLTVTDFWGNEGYATVIINVGETGGPNVDIKVTPGTTGAVPFTVYFDASDTTFETECGVGTATYSWNFGDGSTGTGVTTSHTYTSNGTYTVILTVTDAAGNIGYGSVEITVVFAGAVNAVIIITPDPPTGTAPLTVGLDASESTTSAIGATISTYTWNYDKYDPLVETLTIPVTTHTYIDAGTYLIQLTVEDSLGNKGYAFKSISVTFP